MPQKHVISGTSCYRFRWLNSSNVIVQPTVFFMWHSMFFNASTDGIGCSQHLNCGIHETCVAKILQGRWLDHLNSAQFVVTELRIKQANTHTHHTSLTALFPGLPRSAGTGKVKPVRVLLKQETVSGSGISWAVCNSAPRSRQITTPAPHRSVFYRPDALPAAQPTVSKHWRQQNKQTVM